MIRDTYRVAVYPTFKTRVMTLSNKAIEASQLFLWVYFDVDLFYVGYGAYSYQDRLLYEQMLVIAK